MKKYLRLAGILFISAAALLIIASSSCSKVFDPEDNLLDLDCAKLNGGLLQLNSDIVGAEVNKLTVDLKPSATSIDSNIHEKNLNRLIIRLNDNCNELNAQLICFACILTNPPQSEILVQVDSLGTMVFRVLDILTPINGALKCIRVHEF